MKINELYHFSIGIINCYYENIDIFTLPPVTKVQFEAMVETYQETFIAYDRGGKAQRPAFVSARKALIVALDKIAYNVNEVAQGSEKVVVEGGFKPVKTTRTARHEPEFPRITLLKRGNTGELIAACQVMEGDVSFGCVLVEGIPLPEEVHLLNGILIFPKGINVPVQIHESKARKKHFQQLTPGVTYYLYFFARNAAGVTSLSVGKSIMCA